MTAHAALTMVTIEDNPPTASTPAEATFYYYGLVDGRKRLAEPYSARDGYTGYCLAMTPILIPVVSTFKDKDAKVPSKEVLLAVSKLLREAYARQKGYPALLGIGAQEVELLMQPIKEAAKEAAKEGKPL